MVYGDSIIRLPAAGLSPNRSAGWLTFCPTKISQMCKNDNIAL